MIKIPAVVFMAVSAFAGNAQNSISTYLNNHHYAFSVDNGFDQPTSDSLKRKLGEYKIILQAQGGSHLLNIYKKLGFVWIKFLNANFGLTHFFVEYGHSADIFMNRSMQTGDTSYCNLYGKSFWKSLYTYNSNLPPGSKLNCFGIDFERPCTYVKALRSLLPETIAPADIQPAVELIKNANDSSRDCNYIININDRLKKDLATYKQQFVEYLGDRYFDFERIVLNKGDCNDVYKDRNKHMASAFLSFDEAFNQPVYYGELGEAHTVLINRNTASILNKSEKFKGKLCVINVYCYNCIIDSKQLLNWPFRKIEKDILAYFLPYCETDFTLFDLTGNTELTEKYNAYGQFLIIAKNQGQ
jgi:hypothetical protein